MLVGILDLEYMRLTYGFGLISLNGRLFGLEVPCPPGFLLLAG